ncbi:MAG: GlsB/YeaQ/YmgE family stress response membrane protein [Myxococcaceae bacterium]|nr:MAG: GlsB/YeaQ/YmgE family stress response membrane protein [Myxococcaceae bacterium]
MGIISMVVVGLIAGLIARAIMPGADPMGWIATIILGVVGSFVGGFLASAVLGRSAGNGLEPAGIVGSIIGALIVLAIYRMAKRRSA